MKSLLRTIKLAAALAVGVLAGACASGPPAPSLTPPPDAVVISANFSQFTPASVSAPAGEAFQIWFNNLENVPHNVHVQDAAGTSIEPGEVFNGPAAQTVDVPALSAGTYRLVCDVHPGMTAELVATQ